MEPNSRPVFPHVLLELQRPDFKLLTWTAEDVAAYTEEARTLGAPLEAGEELFREHRYFFTETRCSSCMRMRINGADDARELPFVHVCSREDGFCKRRQDHSVCIGSHSLRQCVLT